MTQFSDFSSDVLWKDPSRYGLMNLHNRGMRGDNYHNGFFGAEENYEG
jgi:hypothetical protein